MRYKKSRIFGVDCHGPTSKIVSLVLTDYVSRQQKSIFNNKKTPEPRSWPVRPRSEPAIGRLPLDDASTPELPRVVSTPAPQCLTMTDDDDRVGGGAVATHPLIIAHPPAPSLVVMVEPSLTETMRTVVVVELSPCSSIPCN
jgi:hypothetical protein